ncbi:MAG: C4-dicarboxylate ABC transporter permease, partial [Candidatus Rifleibacteriota bacterium]
MHIIKAKNQPEGSNMTQSNTAFKVPHTLVIIFSLIIIAALVTYFVPGGKFERVEKQVQMGPVTETREVVVPGSYKPSPAVPQSPWTVLKAIMKGMRHHSAVDIIFFILLIGGAFGVVTETRAVEASLSGLVKFLGSNEKAVIPVVMLVFSLGGASFGMCEETIPFVAMAVPLALKLGYDSITGVAMVYLAAMIGFATAFLNPFTVGIAQGIAELKPFSGIGFR